MANNHASFIWSIADLLRGSYKRHEYGDIILPFTVLRRLDCVLEPTKDAVLATADAARREGRAVTPGLLRNRAGHPLSFYTTSRFTMRSVLGDPDQIAANLLDYVNGFDENVRDIFAKYKLADRIQDLDEHGLLYLVTQRFAEVDLHPDTVPNEEMGHIFEELIRKFAEASNETAGEHFTPRDVIALMVDVLLSPDERTLATPNIVQSVYDPTAGTGGMLSIAEDRIRAMNPTAKLTLAGQELNPQSYAICKADMTVKGQRMEAIQFGDTLLDDKHAGETFNYGLSNPPFGVDWKKQQAAVTEEHRVRGFAGRFGAGLPAVSDGSMLFLLHLVSKMRKPSDGGNGGRAAIVLNGSPLFTGAAGSGPSNIRRWLLDTKDYVEAIIALPTDMFYNTGIATYVWVLAAEKAPERRRKVQLIDGSKLFTRMRKGLGSKRNEIGQAEIDEIVQLHGAFETGERSKIFDVEDFLYRAITVERPLRQRFHVTPERVVDALAARGVVRALAKLDGDVPPRVRAALASLDPERVWMSRTEFLADLTTALVAASVAPIASLTGALADALGESDDEAEVVRDAKGNALPDVSRRETENVPWCEEINEYFAREVTPFAADAWIDESKTKEGCDIPFTRHFYVYTPPRPLEEIDEDLDRVLSRIRARLEAVRG